MDSANLVWMNEQIQRQTISNRACTKTRQKGDVSVKVIQQQPVLLVSKTKKLLYCSIPMTASGKWKETLTNTQVNKELLPGQQQSQEVLLPIGSFTDEETAVILSNYTKLIVVRHPFDRLLAIHSEKIAKINQLGTNKSHVYEILQKPKISPSRDDPGPVDVDDFVKYVTDETDEPLWMPYQDICYPCTIKYDYILQLETMKRDAVFFMKIGLNITSSAYLRNLEKQFKQPSKLSNNDIEKRLNKTTKDAFFHVYAKDLDMFNYSW